MKAIVHEEKIGIDGVNFKTISEPELKPNHVKIKMKTAGMNRRDILVTYRRQEGAPPLILGSDGAGVVDAIGENVTKWKVGDEVIINPGIGWEIKSDVPPEGYEIVGLPFDGTFSEYTVFHENQIEKKPQFLTWEEAGVLSLAALTAYRALFTRGQLKSTDTVMLPGIGSGVLTFALEFAKAIGARVIVTSRSEAKLEKAQKLGADVGILTDSNWNEQLKDESVDLLIETVGRATFNKSLDIVRRGGTIVTFGATTEDIVEIDIRKFFYAQQNILGSTMGSTEELREMLNFIEEHEIRPEIDQIFSMDQYKEAFNYLKDSQNFGKIGIRIE